MFVHDTMAYLSMNRYVNTQKELSQLSIFCYGLQNILHDFNAFLNHANRVLLKVFQ